MPIEHRAHITRAMLKAEPNKLFVFGDNMIRKGMGGQAAEMRGEPNAVGIPTKVLPSMATNAFLSDHDFDEWYTEAFKDIRKLQQFTGTIVWPKQGIGTGRARLYVSSPKIARYLANLLSELM